METKVNYTLVGAFVIILTAMLVLAIIWLSSGLSLKKYVTYAIYMQESVSGLSIDSSVEFNGVGVGKVKSIELNKENPSLVEVVINIKAETPITQGTYATLTTRGLTGLVYIALKDKGEDTQPLKIMNDEKYPVIRTSPSIFVRLDTVLTQFTKNFRQISDSFQALLDRDNLAALKNTLHNLQTVTHSLAVNSNKINMILHTSAGAMNTLEVDTLPATTRTLNNFNELADSLNELSLEIKQNPSILLRGVDRHNLGPGETQ